LDSYSNLIAFTTYQKRNKKIQFQRENDDPVNLNRNKERPNENKTKITDQEETVSQQEEDSDKKDSSSRFTIMGVV
jgi:hypothetical protein